MFCSNGPISWLQPNNDVLYRSAAIADVAGELDGVSI